MKTVSMATMHTVGPETSRLVHRALGVDDARAVLDFNGDPKVMKYTGEPAWTSIEQTRQRLAAYPDFELHGFGRWGCVHKPDNKLIGFSGLKYIDELDEVDLGFRFLPEYWGRGLATESGLACIRFGFGTMGLERIIALVLPDNVASRRVLTKVGMRDEGIIKIYGESAHRFVIERSTWRARHDICDDG